MRIILFLLFIVTNIYLVPAEAADPATHCYSFTVKNIPANEVGVSSRQERWCYQKQSAAGDELYIYNADYAQVRPELALLKKQNGVLVHGSLSAGEVSMHSVSLLAQKFNPFPVPLDEPRNLAALNVPLSAELLTSAKDVLARMSEAEDSGSLQVVAGVTTAEASHKPWRGYWWPFKGLTIAGPLGKYDAFSTARDVPGRSVRWERSNHTSHGLWWEGHCNGWAAASIIRRQPTAPVEDSVSGQTFSVSDLKGILTEADFCVSASMFGSRYDGGRGDRLSDIDPDVFHTALTYYIGKLHKPMAMDYRRDAVVDNHVISGYTMKIEENSPDELTVTATLRMHQYDGSIINVPGTAPAYNRIYRYTLHRKSDGSVDGGHWITENPDFLWVPLSPGPCRSGNTGLSAEMMKNLFH
ncbi:MAG: hypothetical protein ACXWQO_13555 [Bdellovibrionota bacterium]